MKPTVPRLDYATVRGRTKVQKAIATAFRFGLVSLALAAAVVSLELFYFSWIAIEDRNLFPASAVISVVIGPLGVFLGCLGSSAERGGGELLWRTIVLLAVVYIGTELILFFLARFNEEASLLAIIVWAIGFPLLLSRFLLRDKPKGPF